MITKDTTLFTIPCEAIFNQHPKVFRSALVGVGPTKNKKPIICVELNEGDNQANKKDLTSELVEMAKQNEMTKNIETVLYHKSFPVDIRHNSKIFRERLAIWAGKKLR